MNAFICFDLISRRIAIFSEVFSLKGNYIDFSIFFTKGVFMKKITCNKAKKKFIVIGMGLCLGMTALGVGISMARPGIDPTMAEGSVKVSVEELDKEIAAAKKVDNLNINIKNVDVESLFKDKTARQDEIYLNNGKQLTALREAVKKQKEHNKEFIKKSNDPQYLLSKYKSGFDKGKIIDFLNNNQKFDYAFVNDLNIGRCQSFRARSERVSSEEVEKYRSKYYPDITGNDGSFLMYYADKTESEGGIYRVKEGDVFTFEKAIRDKKTGKMTDVVFTVKSLVRSGNSGMDIAGFGRDGSWTSFGDIKKVVWDIDYFESETGDPVRLDILYNSMDLDLNQKITIANTNRTLLSKDTTVLQEGDSAVGTVMLEPSETRGWALFLCRGVSHQEIAWESLDDNSKGVNWSMVSFGPSGMEFNEPVCKMEKIDITRHRLKVTNEEMQKGIINYVDGDMDNKLLKSDELEGHGGEEIKYSTAPAIKSFYEKGYDFVSSDYPDDGSGVFDMDGSVDQAYTVVLKHHTEDIAWDRPKKAGDRTPRKEVVYEKGLDERDLNKSFKRVISYKFEKGDKAGKDVDQLCKINRNARFNYVTRKIIYSDWTEGEMKEVRSPDISGYKPDKEVVEAVKVDHKSKVKDHTVIYKPLKIKELKRSNNGVGKRKISTGSKTVKYPQTGDENRLPLYMLLVAACGSSVLVLVLKKKGE